VSPEEFRPEEKRYGRAPPLWHDIRVGPENRQHAKVTVTNPYDPSSIGAESTMPLGIDTSPRTVMATLHYLKLRMEKLAPTIPEPQPESSVWCGIDDPREMTIEDARGRESEFALDRSGFQLVEAATHVRDFYSPEEVKNIYYPEVVRLLRDILGASRVFVFDHGVRNAARPGGGGPSRRIHNDQNTKTAPQRVLYHLGADAPELLKHRFGIVNVWRPIRGPVLDSPLALCDARTFTDDDLIESDLVDRHPDPGWPTEGFDVRYNSEHRWYYFSEMETDEALLMRVYDSASDGRARLSFHTSFDNPLALSAPPRQSIEVRALVFFPPAG
jgi:hypothetical protein